MFRAVLSWIIVGNGTQAVPYEDNHSALRTQHEKTAPVSRCGFQIHGKEEVERGRIDLYSSKERIVRRGSRLNRWCSCRNSPGYR